ncbi:hypothetical protein BpsS36_00007 [Bacillus phage vB_BpsS-36]|uniref:Uncharacterized protein n=1 Tax=Bacillus phage vB_BpsS-36 TaxID=2419622 RepID=A0A3G3BWP6_9CAUD|nr:hypothetical protein BpsS36_00007 [Bacillus phage vB_BpsS-36]
MLQTIKGRTLEEGQRVFVYFNLHRKVFSVKDLKTGLVVAHTDEINLYDCTFKVSEAGRQRVLKEQKKNVHAGVVGTYQESSYEPDQEWSSATYNPYKYDSFVNKETEEALKHSYNVHLKDKAIKYYN